MIRRLILKSLPSKHRLIIQAAYPYFFPYDLRNKLLRHALSLGYDYAESAAAVAELTETPEIPCDDF